MARSRFAYAQAVGVKQSPVAKEEFVLVTRAVSSWSLHRTLGRFVAADSAVGGGRFMNTQNAHPTARGLALLDLPAELRRRGYDALQICHFHLPSRSPAYLGELRAALAESHIALDAILIDDGDLTNRAEADRAEAWIGGWLDTATALGARRARVGAGRSTPVPEAIRESAKRLGRLAAAHPDVRVVTENWLGMTPGAGAVLALLEATGGAVGLLIDLGNWSGPEKYAELARIAPCAETSHAKCHFTGSNAEREDFRLSLQALAESGFNGPLALIYDGRDDDEWAKLDFVHELVHEVFP